MYFSFSSVEVVSFIFFSLFGVNLVFQITVPLPVLSKMVPGYGVQRGLCEPVAMGK